MKHYFIVNPVSGKGKASNAYISVIEEYIKKTGLNAEIYVTKEKRDGQHFVEEIAKKGEAARFYACGGDGTLYEAVNGCYKYPNCQVAVIPLGSGNDFVRLFGRTTELDDHVNGVPVKLDLIKTGDKVAINQCSMGLDAEVCVKQADFKKLPFVGGELAYYLAAISCLLKGKLNNEFKITVDGKTFEDNYLFCYIGNSRWYGGGFMAGPRAMPNDGLIDVVMVRRDRGILGLLPLINKYKRGEHLDMDITTFIRGKRVKIESKKPAAVNIDGECSSVMEREFEIIENGITFVVPKNSDFLKENNSAVEAIK